MARYAYDDDDEDYDLDGCCQFCGRQDCDGTGYNCDELDDYNLRD